jgi:hypothetical protein
MRVPEGSPFSRNFPLQTLENTRELLPNEAPQPEPFQKLQGFETHFPPNEAHVSPPWLVPILRQKSLWENQNGDAPPPPKEEKPPRNSAFSAQKPWPPPHFEEPLEVGIGNPGHRGAIFEKLPSRIIKDRQEEIVPPQAPLGFGFEETEKLVRLARRRTGHEPPVGSCDMVAEVLAKLEKTELILEKKCVEIPVFGTQHHTQEGVSPSLLTISNAHIFDHPDVSPTNSPPNQRILQTKNLLLVEFSSDSSDSLVSQNPSTLSPVSPRTPGEGGGHIGKIGYFGVGGTYENSPSLRKSSKVGS